MASTSTYLNFPGTTEQAFAFYASVFGTQQLGPTMYMDAAPSVPGAPPLADADKKLVMHIALPILGDHVLMGTDAVESMGHPLTMGNNFSLQLAPDSRADADRLYAALSAGGKATTPMQEMFWGAYWGACVDRFGVQWMVNCTAKS